MPTTAARAVDSDYTQEAEIGRTPLLSAGLQTPYFDKENNRRLVYFFFE